MGRGELGGEFDLGIKTDFVLWLFVGVYTACSRVSGDKGEREIERERERDRERDKEIERGQEGRLSVAIEVVVRLTDQTRLFRETM